MRPVYRSVFAILSALSLLLFVALCFLWATSYHRFRFFSHGGRVLVLVVRANRQTDRWLRIEPPTLSRWGEFRPGNTWRAAGFEVSPLVTRHNYFYTSESDGRDVGGVVTIEYRLLAIPYWFLAAVAAAPPLAWLRVRLRARARRRAGR